MPPKIPIWVKLFYTAFAAVLVPFYWQEYGPTNFLYFCDVALLMTVPALWLENRLLASAPLVGILLPQILWQFDFLAGLADWQITGMTAYMFNPAIPLFTRGLSFFHFWLPLFLLWVVWRLGYDRRAFAFWTFLAWGLMAVCYFLMPPPHAPRANPNLPVNINYVYGFSDDRPQEWMDPLLYLGLMMLAMTCGIFLPAHLFFSRVFPEKQIPR